MMPKNLSLERAIEIAQTPLEKTEALNALALEICHADTHRSKSLAEDALRLCNSRSNLVEHEQRWCLQKALALITLGICNERSENYRLSLAQTQEALAIYQNVNDKKGQADALKNIGIAYCRLAEYVKALEFFRQSLSFYEDIKDKEGQAKAIANIGTLYSGISDYGQALVHYHQSHSLFEELGCQLWQVRLLNNLGHVYYKMADYKKATTYLTKSLAIAKSLGDQYIQLHSLFNIGKVYSELADYEQALIHFQNSLTIAKGLGNQQMQAATYTCFGKIYYELGDYEKALSYHIQSLSLFEKLNDRYGQAYVLFLFGQTLIKLRRFEEAETLLHKALAFCDELGLKKERYETLECLADLYSQIGDIPRAFDFYKQFHLAKEEAFNQEQQQHIARLQITFETEQAKKEAEIAHLKNIELAAANSFKTDLLATAAHDLKSPLQTILGYTQLLRTHKPDEQTSNRYYLKIESGVKNMAQLISDLLDTANTDRSEFTLILKRVHLTDILNDCAKSFLNTASVKGQTIFFNSSIDHAITNGDEKRLIQVFENLISNAIKFSPIGTTIHVSLNKHNAANSTSPATSFLIAVRDEGQGLTAEDKDNLFGKFYKLSAVPTGGEPSSGLGLSIVKRLVELHDGKVWAESEGRGKGTTFFVELPATDLGK
jgi:signal transduction histidine kinase